MRHGEKQVAGAAINSVEINGVEINGVGINRTGFSALDTALFILVKFACFEVSSQFAL